MTKIYYPFINYYSKDMIKVPMKVYRMLVDSGYRTQIDLDPQFGYTITVT